MNKMIEIKWGGRGKRILGPSEGYSQTYTWDGHGAVVAVKQEDALRVLTEPRAQFTCVDPADLASLEAEFSGQPQATVEGRVALKFTGEVEDPQETVLGRIVLTFPDDEPEADGKTEPEPASPKPPARKGRKPSGTGTKPKKADADA